MKQGCGISRLLGSILSVTAFCKFLLTDSKKKRHLTIKNRQRGSLQLAMATSQRCHHLAGGGVQPNWKQIRTQPAGEETDGAEVRGVYERL